MICGALQTLNEEAMEDVMEEADDPTTSLQVPEAGQFILDLSSDTDPF